MKPCFKVLLAALTCAWTVNIYAQKLPNKQEVSLRAPSNVKIDGKATEWNDQFQAYNRATNVFYTLSNDNENLYLTIKAIDQDVINKIVGGGISFIIARAGKKNDKDNIAITYPVITNTYFNLRGKKGVAKDTSIKAADSIMRSNNNILMYKCKWIKVTGIKGLDTLISAYNQDGIKALGLFDNKKAYTCELSVSLEQIGLKTANSDKFAYHIRLNGSNVLGTYDLTNASYSDPSPENVAKIQGYFAKFNESNAQLAAPTDFEGEYTIAKK